MPPKYCAPGRGVENGDRGGKIWQPRVSLSVIVMPEIEYLQIDTPFLA